MGGLRRTRARGKEEEGTCELAVEMSLRLFLPFDQARRGCLQFLDKGKMSQRINKESVRFRRRQRKGTRAHQEDRRPERRRKRGGGRLLL